jgi:two-component system sensor histidine kinase YesM
MEKGKTIRRQFYISFGAFFAVALVSFLFYYIYSSVYMQKSAEKNLSFVVQELSKRVNTYFSGIEKAASSFATSSTVQNFLEVDYIQRYDMLKDINNFYNSAAEQAEGLSGVVLLDQNGNFYRYGSVVLSNQDCARLNYNYRGKKAIRTVYHGSNESYFIVVTPVYDMSGKEAVYVGNVIACSKTSQLRTVMDEYRVFYDFTIALSKDNLILTCTDEKLEGTKLSVSSAFQEKSNYLRGKEIYFGSFYLQTAVVKSKLFPYSNFFGIIAAILLLTFFLLWNFIRRINHNILTPISKLVEEVQALKGKALKARLQATQSTELNLLVESVNSLLERIEDYSRTCFFTQQKLYEAELQKQRDSLYLLRKQINTHFIFNSLNSIRILAEKDQKYDISLIANGIASLIHYAYNEDEYIDLFDEMQMIEQYVNIMSISLQDQIKLEFEVDDQLCGCLVLRQIIQPIVENAINHGLKKKSGEKKILITGLLMGNDIFLSVADNGVGFSAERLKALRKRVAERQEIHALTGIALANINRRIYLYYGERYGVTVDSTEGTGAEIAVRLPYITKGSKPRFRPPMDMWAFFD